MTELQPSWKIGILAVLVAMLNPPALAVVGLFAFGAHLCFLVLQYAFTGGLVPTGEIVFVTILLPSLALLCWILLKSLYRLNSNMVFLWRNRNNSVAILFE